MFHNAVVNGWWGRGGGGGGWVSVGLGCVSCMGVLIINKEYLIWYSVRNTQPSVPNTSPYTVLVYDTMEEIYKRISHRGGGAHLRSSQEDQQAKVISQPCTL